MTTAKVIRWSGAAVLILGAIWLNATQLIEAYGSGPPYYGRTTNMDKWDNPIPFLIAVDLAVLSIIAVLLAPGVLRLGPRRRDVASSE